MESLHKSAIDTSKSAFWGNIKNIFFLWSWDVLSCIFSECVLSTVTLQLSLWSKQSSTWNLSGNTFNTLTALEKRKVLLQTPQYCYKLQKISRVKTRFGVMYMFVVIRCQPLTSLTHPMSPYSRSTCSHNGLEFTDRADTTLLLEKYHFNLMRHCSTPALV